MSFLSELVSDLVEPGRIDYHDLVIVLPNKRAMKNLYREWSFRLSTPVFAPAIFTIDDLIKKLSPIESISNAELLVELFQVTQKFPSLKETDFQKFVSWGGNFLKDINEIDMYGVDGAKIFDAQYAFKETSFVLQPHLSKAQEKYLSLFKSLYPLYQEYTNHLKEIKKGYAGLIYRDVAEHIDIYAKELPWNRMVFAGLQVFTPSELAVVKFFQEHFSCKFIFDLDRFYYEDDHDFKIKDSIDSIAKKLRISQVQNIHNDYQDIPKKINVLGVSKKLTQIYQAIQILEQCSEEELRETAVVLADESLLVPFVHAYSQANCNITMGYPLKYSQTCQLLQTLLKAAQNTHRFQQVAPGTYYHKDVMAILHNSLFKSCFFETEYDHETFTKKLIKSNRIFFGKNIFDSYVGSFPDLEKDGVDFINSIILFFSVLLNKAEKSPEQKIIQLLIEALEEVAHFIGKFPSEIFIDVRTIIFFIEEKLQAVSIPFQRNEGAPLQVMGLLETRALDFKHVIILSVNEGVIPVMKSENTLLLMDIKRNFGLPTMQQNEAVYAYHFFRLLQRAEKIDLIYNAVSSSSSQGVAEESRFIRQLEWRMQQMQLPYAINRGNALYIPPKMSAQPNKIEIPNNETIRDYLKNFTYSASSLNAYIACPLKFYLKYVAHIEPEETIEESVEQRVLGNVMHKILENTFEELRMGQNGSKTGITEEQVSSVLQKYFSEEYINQIFKEQEEVRDRDLQRGKIFLAREVVKKILNAYQNVVKEDILNKKITIIALEMELFAMLGIDDFEIKLKGTLDRVELRNNDLTILDYKTGIVKKMGYTKMENLFSDVEQGKLLQLMIYAYLYRHGHQCGNRNGDLYPQTERIECAIVSFQQLMKKSVKESDCFLYPQDEKTKSNLNLTALLDEFEIALKNFLQTMIASEKFAQCPESDHCKYCDYNEICGRN